MENYIEITKVVKERVPLTRKPTADELAMIKNDEMFNTETLIDWDKSEVIEEDYSYGRLDVQFENKQLYYRNGKHF
jgi:hypothetical protein